MGLWGLNSLKRAMLIIQGSIVGVLKEDARSLDYNSRVVRGPGSRDSLKVVGV